jgi:hypothetical protein
MGDPVCMLLIASHGAGAAHVMRMIKLLQQGMSIQRHCRIAVTDELCSLNI